ncbi:uncharacterized protein APUU_81009A, partial [Aspergillus puulaauensis]
ELQIFNVDILPCVAEIPSIEILNDGSFEIVARKVHLPALQNAVQNLFLNAQLDKNYNPLNPTGKDVALGFLLGARKMAGISFYRRALRVTQSDDARAAAFYRYLLDINSFQRN